MTTMFIAKSKRKVEFGILESQLRFVIKRIISKNENSVENKNTNYHLDAHFHCRTKFTLCQIFLRSSIFKVFFKNIRQLRLQRKRKPSPQLRRRKRKMLPQLRRKKKKSAQ